MPFESLKRTAKDRKAYIDDAAEYVAALKVPLTIPSRSPTTTAAREDTEMADAEADTDTPAEPTTQTPDATTPPPSHVPASVAGGSLSSLPDAQPCPASAPSFAAAATAREASLERLRLLLSQLQGVKRKLADVTQTEADDCSRCRARLEHLSGARPASSTNSAQQQEGIPSSGLVPIPWTRTRLDILLVDHLLRNGHYDTATRLATTSGIGLLTDAHVFDSARRIVSALLHDHDCSPALAWCADNRARLFKVKSPLEFKLHVQRFIELRRTGDRPAAITYARRNLAPWAGLYMAELQRAVTALVFTPTTRSTVYRALFDESQWRSLADLFLRDLYRLNSLTPESLLHVYLQAGLSALKTPASGKPGGSREDPLRLPAFQRLAAQLPYAKHMHSKLLCAVTRELMSDANPPVVLPNGMVYSQRGVDQLMAQHAWTQGDGGGGVGEAGRGLRSGGGGGIDGASAPQASVGVCPATGLVFRRDELRRAFIV